MRSLKDLDDYAYETWVEERSYTTPYYTPQKKTFYDSPEWLALRRKVFDKYEHRCAKCGDDERTLQVDHVKSRFYFPELALDINNLQILCKRCNADKGIDCMDYRK